MMKAIKRLWLIACLVCLAVHPAWAETRSTGYAIWNVEGGNVRVLYSVPRSEVPGLAAPGRPAPTTRQVADYVLAHLAVSRQGRMCPVVDQGEDIGKINTLALIPGYLRFEVVFQCPDNAGLTLSDTAFADRVENHVDFARVQVNNGGFFQHTFTAGEPRLSLSGTPAAGRSDSVLRYAAFGLSHAFRSLDSLFLMLALLFIARRRQDYIVAAGALFAGYVLAAMLSPFDLVAPRFGAAHGLLILVAAATGMALSLLDPRKGAAALGGSALVIAVAAFALQGFAAACAVLGTMLVGISALFNPLAESRRAVFLAVIAVLFGFLDGFVLTSDLTYLSLPATQLTPMVFGFNFGSFLGDIAIPASLVTVWFLAPVIRRLMRPGNLISDLAGSVLTGCGVFWFGSWLFT